VWENVFWQSPGERIPSSTPSSLEVTKPTNPFVQGGGHEKRCPPCYEKKKTLVVTWKGLASPAKRRPTKAARNEKQNVRIKAVKRIHGQKIKGSEKHPTQTNP